MTARNLQGSKVTFPGDPEDVFLFQPNMGVNPTRNESSQQRPRAHHTLLCVVTLLYLLEWKRVGEFAAFAKGWGGERAGKGRGENVGVL